MNPEPFSARAWEFWIDAGGTFTDCLARPVGDAGGAIRTHKLLSTGRYPGRVAPDSTAASLLDPVTRAGDSPGFFVGWTLTCDLPGSGRCETRVITSSRGELQLHPPLPADPPADVRYELSCSLEAPVIGIRWLLGRGLDEPLPPGLRVRLGTTRATNALLEHRGARVAFVTTAGFGDAPLIGSQDRPELFNLDIAPPAALHERVIELHERLDADGRVLLALAPAEVTDQLTAARAAGIEALAVCLLHSSRNPAHETGVGRIARELGFTQVSLSSELAPLPKFVPRADTALADAYLTPVLRAYCDRLAAQLPGADLRFMTSAGNLVRRENFHGKDALLSGPAGGVVGASRVAARAGAGAIIAFDMGGTSTDVSRWDGGEEFARRFEVEVGSGGGTGGTPAPRPLRLLTPMLEIETVAAGGGSVCGFDGQKVAVGPRSAGADPGPACYGRGGPLCVTDVNFFLGRIPRFPFALDRDVVEARLDALISEVNQCTGAVYTREKLAQGFLDVANASMVEPIRKLSAARGDDVRERTLVPFGGAGGQHACALARELGMTRVLCNPFAGVLSALGIGLAPTAKLRERAVGRPLESLSASELESLFAPLETDTRAAMTAESINPGALPSPRRTLELRYAGQETRLSVPAETADPRAAFEREHRRLYGFALPGRGVEVYAVRSELSTGAGSLPAGDEPASGVPHVPEPAGRTRAFFDGAWRDAAFFERSGLRPGARFGGPAIVLEGTSTVVVEPGWTAEVSAGGDLRLHFDGAEPNVRPAATATADDDLADPVELELFHQRFASIAEQMGAALQRTALSVNVKERLDFSCAVFDADGQLVANAPHIPVHLGAMGECVRCLREDVPDPQPGETLVTNDPFRGGSHLPDVTVTTPVWDESGREIVFWTASRAHHAEIGGVSPGSMSPGARTLAEEGVLIRAFRHRPGDPASEERLRGVFLHAPFPTRNVEENLADLHAQVAANATGARLLAELSARHGPATVRRYAAHLRRTTEAKMRAALARLPAGERRCEDRMDDNTPVVVTVTLNGPGSPAAATFDFTGTGPVHPGNLNANPAIVASAVTYCLRCLLGGPIPLNAGLLDAVAIRIPPGSLLDPPTDPDPARCPAVAGGNVETSQRLVDVILGALGLAAGSQGTMNNLLFGGPGFGYYETIGGGAGATPAADGASAVHTHMTNTRLTDPETLETRYPVRLRQWSIRHGSGGAGTHRGGDGMIREIEFLAPLEVSLLTSRRTTQPPGLAGGEPGAPGCNLLQRNGALDWETLPGAAQFTVGAGDVLRLEAPGGGGWGAAVLSS